MPETITVLSLEPTQGDGPVRARATARLGSTVVRNLRLVTRKDGNGYFVGFPARRNPDGTFEDVVFLPDADAREVLLAALVRAYEQHVPSGV